MATWLFSLVLSPFLVSPLPIAKRPSLFWVWAPSHHLLLLFYQLYLICNHANYNSATLHSSQVWGEAGFWVRLELTTSHHERVLQLVLYQLCASWVNAEELPVPKVDPSIWFNAIYISGARIKSHSSPNTVTGKTPPSIRDFNNAKPEGQVMKILCSGKYLRLISISIWGSSVCAGAGRGTAVVGVTVDSFSLSPTPLGQSSLVYRPPSLVS